MLDKLHSYVFDTTGCVIIKKFIPMEEVNRAKSSILKNWPTANGVSTIPWKFPIMHLDRVFWEFLTKPLILDFCEEFCGDYFRLDHAFGLSSNKAISQLHGGPQSSQNSCFYLPRGGNHGLVGQLNFGFCLEPQNGSTGGFVYIPGSHKSSDSRAGKEILEDVFKGNFAHHSLVTPVLEPGDLMIFTEALIHGDTGWKDNSSYRMQAYYKMTPGFMCWRDPSQNIALKQFALTDLELRLIEAPWTGRYSETATSMGTSNQRRPKTRNAETYANS